METLQGQGCLAQVLPSPNEESSRESAFFSLEAQSSHACKFQREILQVEIGGAIFVSRLNAGLVEIQAEVAR